MDQKLRTIKGYDFHECTSAMQKAIRRADAAVAGYFALELWHSGYWNYVWKRLFTISAEDCHGLITKEIEALYNGYMLVNKGAKTHKGRIFISKAVILLCHVAKSRDADHLQCIIYDKDMVDADSFLEEVRQEMKPIPTYAFDCHTQTGRRMGKTKEDFFKEEFNALSPKQLGLFDNLI